MKLDDALKNISLIAFDTAPIHNLRSPDALQIAIALENNCDAFLCNDNGLMRVIELQILVLDNLEL